MLHHLHLVAQPRGKRFQVEVPVKEGLVPDVVATADLHHPSVQLVGPE
jgi:hypothetical protein